MSFIPHTEKRAHRGRKKGSNHANVGNVESSQKCRHTPPLGPDLGAFRASVVGGDRDYVVKWKNLGRAAGERKLKKTRGNIMMYFTRQKNQKRRYINVSGKHLKEEMGIEGVRVVRVSKTQKKKEIPPESSLSRRKEHLQRRTCNGGEEKSS